MPGDERTLTDEELATYEWQLWVAGFGVEGQRRLRRASVLVSRCGGLGGAVAYELAAAGIGRLILAHAGNVKPADLNRQLLMTHDWIGKPRVESAARRLRELNPRLEVTAEPENVSAGNVARLVAEADLVVDCAPLFEERFLMHDEARRQGKPLVHCAMFELEGRLATFLPASSPCLRCLYPERPQDWKREFPVFGAVSGAVGCFGAMEAIKLLSGLGTPLAGEILSFDLRDMRFLRASLTPNPACTVCGPRR